MPNERPLLSIVVPTKGRYLYLKFLITYFVELDIEDVELIIQDNTPENKEILNFLSKRQQSNIKYYHTKQPITIGENSDKAILNSTGEYVCYIGDDDSFSKSIVNVVYDLKRLSCDAAVFPRPHFMWKDIKNNKHFTTAQYMKAPTNKVRWLSGVTELENTLNSGGNFNLNLPHIYHGIVSRKKLDELYGRCGTYFPGPSPDMANAVGLAAITDRYLYIDYPTVVAGTSGARIKGNENGDRQSLSSVNFLNRQGIQDWCHPIPRVWTVPTIYAQTLYYSLKQLKSDKWKLFNWTQFWINVNNSFVDLVPEEQKKQIRLYVIRNKIRNRLKGALAFIKPLYYAIKGCGKIECNQETVHDYIRCIENKFGLYKTTLL